MWAPTTPVTGGTMIQFTTPTYTLTADTAPDVNGKQHAITALGGTQTGVRVHAVSDPFTVTMFRPKSPSILPSPNSVTGKYPAIPKNTYTLVARKGVNYAANNAPAVATLRMSADIPAGADAYDAVNVRALECLVAGIIAQQSQGIGDLWCNGIL
jgi:hypothetical protein